MATDAIHAAISPVKQEQTPVTQKKSTWNNFCVTVKKGCSKTVEFFKNIFRAVGNFFKAIGKFLWNNKVTAAVCAFFSATILAISACFLAMFGKKKQAKESQSEADKVEKEVKPAPAKVVIDTDDEKLKSVETVEQQEKKQNGLSSVISQFEAMPNKAEQAKQNDKVAKTGLIERMQEQLKKSQEKDAAEKTNEHPVITTGLVQQMQQQIQAEKEEAAKKEDTEKKDVLRSSVDFDNMHSLLANVRHLPGQQPAATQPKTVVVVSPAEEHKHDDSSANSEAKAEERNTQELSDKLKAKPRVTYNRRPPTRKPRTNTTAVN